MKQDTPSAAARRMRRYRERFKTGARPMVGELSAGQVDALIRHGLLADAELRDARAVGKAVQKLVARLLRV